MEPKLTDFASILRDIFGNPWKLVTLCGMERKPFHNQYAHVDANGGFWLEADCHACARFRTATVVSLAQAIYDERDFTPERMGYLWDALADAGCTDEAIEKHCKCEEQVWSIEYHDDEQPGGRCMVYKGWQSLRGPHVRGCWCLDILLGKQSKGA